MNEETVRAAMATAQSKAWNALARYKFWMFGYHAAQWVLLNQLFPVRSRQPNPFKPLVRIARDVAAHADGRLRIRKVA
jgi:hypothetical protein